MIKAYTDCEYRGIERIIYATTIEIDDKLPYYHPINCDHTLCKEPDSNHYMYCMSNLEADKCPKGFRL